MYTRKPWELGRSVGSLSEYRLRASG
jgi:hypothetical protein